MFVPVFENGRKEVNKNLASSAISIHMYRDCMQTQAKISKEKLELHAKIIEKREQNQNVTLAMNEWRQFIVTFK